MKTFKREDLQTLAYGDTPHGFMSLGDVHVEHTRWSEVRLLTFGFGGRFYQVKYRSGLTEYQDEQPFEDGPEDVPCIEVYQVEKRVMVWEPVNGLQDNTAHQ